MKPEHVQILTETYRRTRQHEQTTRPEEWRYWETRPWDEEESHGPAYGCGAWFGPLPNHERQRLLRAIADLEEGGLLVTWSRYGRRLSHIRLTPTGEAVAKDLVEADRLERRRAGR